MHVSLVKVIECASKKLTSTEIQYGITEKSLYVLGIKKFEFELRDRRLRLEMNHKVLFKMSSTHLYNNRINGWIDFKQRLDTKIVYIEGKNGKGGLFE